MSTRDYEDLSSAVVKLACDDYRAVMTDENDRVEIPSTGDYVISCKHRCTEAVLTDIRDRLCFQKRKDNSCDL